MYYYKHGGIQIDFFFEKGSYNDEDCPISSDMLAKNYNGGECPTNFFLLDLIDNIIYSICIKKASIDEAIRDHKISRLVTFFLLILEGKGRNR